MGIGISLATGLVQGFTRNIQEEKARRMGEQEKLDATHALVLDAALTGGEDYNAEAGKKIMQMIQASQNKIDSRERIGLFGQEGEKINTDFTGVLSTLKSAGTYESKVGGFEFGVDVNKFGKGDSFAALTDMANVFNTDTGRARLEAASNDELEALHRTIASHKYFLSNEYETAKAAGVDYDIKLDEQFALFDPFDEIYTKRIVNGISTGDAAGSDPDDNSVGAKVVSVDEKFTVDFTDVDLGQDIQIVAQNFGFKDPQEFANFWDEYTNISGFTYDQKQMVLDGAATLSKRYREKRVDLNLDSQSPNFNLTDPDVARDILLTVNILSEGDKNVAALMLGTFSKIANFNPNKQNARFISKKSSGRLHSAQLIFGATATEQDFNKLEEQQNNFDVVLGTEGEKGSGLRGLKYQLANMDGPAAINKLFGMIASGKAIIQSLAGSDEQTLRGGANVGRTSAGAYAVNSIVTDEYAQRNANKINPETGKPEKFLTETFVSGLDMSVAAAYERGLSGKDGSVERAKDYARFEASRIALAFQMARAADPSGRLSNQDIEAQLIRLGTNWDAPEVAVARIEQTIRDFEILRNRYAEIVRVGKSSTNLSVAQKKQINGNYTLVRLGELAGYESTQDAFDRTTSPEKLPAFDSNTMFIDPDNGKVYNKDDFMTEIQVDPVTLPEQI